MAIYSDDDVTRTFSDEEVMPVTAKKVYDDSDVTAISPPSTLDEVIKAPAIGLAKFGASTAKLGSSFGATLDKTFNITGDNPVTREQQTNKEIDKFFGTDKQQELHSIPGKMVETISNVAPYLANFPIAMTGIATMYNDVVNALTEKGIPVDRARKIAGEENGAMLVAGVVGGKTLGAIVGPILSKLGMTGAIGQFAGKGIAGGLGAEGGVQAAREVHNAELEDRPDLQQKYDPKQSIANMLAFGGMAGLHPSMPKPELKPKDDTTTPDLAPEFDSTNKQMSVGERKILEQQSTLLQDKLEKAQEELNTLEEVGKTSGNFSEALVAEMEARKTVIDKATQDFTDLQDILSGKIEGEPTETTLAREMKVQELIQRLRDKQEPQGKSVMDEPLSFEDAQKIDEDINKADETVKEEPPPVGEEPVAAVIPKVEIKDRTKPTSDEVHSLVGDANTMGEVFTTLMKERIGSAGQRALITALAMNKRVGSAIFRAVKGQIHEDGRVGEYDPNTHSVVLAEGGHIGTILHEAVHAAVHDLLIEGKSVASKAMNALYERYKLDHIQKMLPEYYKGLSDKEKLDLPYTDIGGNHYGFNDIHEFVSEAMTNRRFQKLLSLIPDSSVPGKIEHMWNRFKDIIKEGVSKTLGIKEGKARTALDNVLEHGSRLIDEGSNIPFKFKKLSETIPASLKERNPMDDVNTLKRFTAWIGRTTFGKNSMAGFFRDNPRVQKVYKELRRADEAGDAFVNSILYGDVNVEGMSKFSTLTKVKNATSVFMTLSKTPRESMKVLHDLFKRGFELELDYAENLARNGQHLTPDQVKAYNTFSDMFRKMYDGVAALQDGLGKKHVLPYRKGWYPSTRAGDYSVSLNFGGNTAHIQYFKTRAAAELFRRKVSNGTNLRFIQVSDVIQKSKEQAEPNKVMADIILADLQKALPSVDAFLKQRIERLMDSISIRGGKLGYHHQKRLNVEGYKGSELFKSDADLGESFKDGIQASLNNFGQNIRGLVMKTKVEPELNDTRWQEQDPLGYAAATKMYENSRGQNEVLAGSTLEDVANKIDLGISHAMKAMFDVKWNKDEHIVTWANNHAMEVFYNFKMMGKITFAIIGQLLTTPNTISLMSYGNHGLMAWKSYTKGLTKLIAGDKELWQAIKEDSQTFNTIEAQYLESFNLKEHGAGQTLGADIWNGFNDYVLMKVPGQRMDSLSRVVAYAVGLTHHLDLGKSLEVARAEARQLSDQAINVYGSTEGAAVFNHLGTIGKGIRPLQSFGQNMLGNLISTVMNIKPTDYRTYGPFVNFVLAGTLAGGVLSLPFIQEYEKLRLILLEKFNDVSLPSVLEWFGKDNTFIDRLDVPEDAVKRAMLYGTPALTGIDASSSVRANETLFTMMLAVMAGQESALKLFPIQNFMSDVAVGGVNGVKAIVGDTKQADRKKAIAALAPAGAIGYGVNELAGNNTTTVLGKSTNKIAVGKNAEAAITRTPLDVAGSVLGSKSIRQDYAERKNLQLEQEQKIKGAKINEELIQLTETGDPKEAQRHINRLIALGQDGKQIENGIGTNAYKRLVDMDVRFYATKTGAVKKPQAQAFFGFGK